MNRRTWKFVLCLGAISLMAFESAPGQQLVPLPVQGAMQDDNQQLDARLAALEQRLSNAEAEIDLLTRNQTELTANQRALQQVGQELGTMLRQVVEQDGAGNAYVNIRSNMQQPQFREQMRTAVNESISDVGTLRVENQTGTTERLRVNGQDYYLAPFENRDITVPVGTVTTELVGYEAPKHLAVGAPRYRQRLVIRPTPAVVRRPVQEMDVVYGSPAPVVWPVAGAPVVWW